MSKDYGDYTILHRYMSGLTMFCVVIAILGSSIAGVSAEMIAWRAALVVFGFSVAGKVLIKIWASWEDTQQGEASQRKD